MLQIDNLKCQQKLKWCSVALYARLFLLASSTYAPFFLVLPWQVPCCSVSHKSLLYQAILLPCDSLVSSHNTEVCVGESCLPIIVKVSEAETVVVILTGYLVRWFRATVWVNTENFPFSPCIICQNFLQSNNRSSKNVHISKCKNVGSNSFFWLMWVEHTTGFSTLHNTFCLTIHYNTSTIFQPAAFCTFVEWSSL